MGVSEQSHKGLLCSSSDTGDNRRISVVINIIGQPPDTLLSGKALRLTEPAEEEVKTWTKARAIALRQAVGIFGGNQRYDISTLIIFFQRTKTEQPSPKIEVFLRPGGGRVPSERSPFSDCRHASPGNGE